MDRWFVKIDAATGHQCLRTAASRAEACRSSARSFHPGKLGKWLRSPLWHIRQNVGNAARKKRDVSRMELDRPNFCRAQPAIPVNDKMESCRPVVRKLYTPRAGKPAMTVGRTRRSEILENLAQVVTRWLTQDIADGTALAPDFEAAVRSASAYRRNRALGPDRNARHTGTIPNIRYSF